MFMRLKIGEKVLYGRIVINICYLTDDYVVIEYEDGKVESILKSDFSFSEIPLNDNDIIE